MGHFYLHGLHGVKQSCSKAADHFLRLRTTLLGSSFADQWSLVQFFVVCHCFLDMQVNTWVSSRLALRQTSWSHRYCCAKYGKIKNTSDRFVHEHSLTACYVCECGRAITRVDIILGYQINDLYDPEFMKNTILHSALDPLTHFTGTYRVIVSSFCPICITFFLCHAQIQPRAIL